MYKKLQIPPVENIIISDKIQEMADGAFKSSYIKWGDLYLKNEGLPEGQFKIEYNKDKNDTASEVMAYGMLFAVHTGDKKTFDGLWSFAKSHLNEDGLMSWHIRADNKPIDESSAADADLDIAYALYAADQVWGGYEDYAKEMMENILEHDVEKGTNILKGGNDWGGSDETNPSYYSPLYYEIFKEYTGDEHWEDVAKASREVFENIEENADITTDLPPNWATADGKTNVGRDDANGYSHEAIRVPLRQGMLAIYGCENLLATAGAISQLGDVYDFVETIDPDNIDEGFDAEGNPLTEWSNNPAFAGTFAIASLVGDSPELTMKLVENTINWRSEDWVTNEGVRNFSLLVLSGKMIH